MAYMKKEGKVDAVFHAMFRIIDINENDVISLDKWILHYKSYGIDTAHASASFEAMDTNHDGKITMDEFIAYHMEYFFSVEDKLNSSILYGRTPCLIEVNQQSEFVNKFYRSIFLY